MALVLRKGMDGAAVLTNYATFEPGDATVVSETLLGAFLEITRDMLKAFDSYNAANELIPLEAPTLTINDNTRSATITGNINYRKAGAEIKAIEYLNDYSGWTTPTTGEMTGCTNILDAFLYLAKAVQYGNESLRPNVVIANVSDLVAITDNTNQSSFEITATIPVNTSKDAQGHNVTTALNYFTFLDAQENLPA